MLQILIPLSQLALLIIGLYMMYATVVMTPPFLSGLAFTILALNFFLPMFMVPAEQFEGEYATDME